jgi:hypothetical protein
MMKTKLLLLIGVFVVALSHAVADDKGCRSLVIAIAPVIEVPPRDFTAADLLPSGACASWLQSAARIRLGEAPLEGIARVFDAGAIRSILARALSGQMENEKVTVPERVIVRRASTHLLDGKDTNNGGSRSRLRAGRGRFKESFIPPTVRPGQAATLVWDGNGIRVVVPVTCLDRGVSGESVRARIVPSGEVVRAVVVEAGVLHAMS